MAYQVRFYLEIAYSTHVLAVRLSQHTKNLPIANYAAGLNASWAVPALHNDPGLWLLQSPGVLTCDRR